MGPTYHCISKSFQFLRTSEGRGALFVGSSQGPQHLVYLSGILRNDKGRRCWEGDKRAQGGLWLGPGRRDPGSASPVGSATVFWMFPRLLRGLLAPTAFLILQTEDVAPRHCPGSQSRQALYLFPGCIPTYHQGMREGQAATPELTSCSSSDVRRRGSRRQGPCPLEGWVGCRPPWPPWNGLASSSRTPCLPACPTFLRPHFPFSLVLPPGITISVRVGERALISRESGFSVEDRLSWGLLCSQAGAALMGLAWP